MGRTFPNFETQIGACIAGALTFAFDSTVVGAQAAPGAPTFNSNSTADAQQVPLTFDTASLMYSGNGTLNYDSRIFSIDWNLVWTENTNVSFLRRLQRSEGGEACGEPT